MYRLVKRVLGWIFYFSRQYDQAVQELKSTLAMDPNFALAHLFLGWEYQQKGMFTAAIGELQKATGFFAGWTGPAALGQAYTVAGRRAEALKVLDELSQHSKRRNISFSETEIALI